MVHWALPSGHAIPGPTFPPQTAPTQYWLVLSQQVVPHGVVPAPHAELQSPVLALQPVVGQSVSGGRVHVPL